jgi:peptidoglycan/xylan/chitin deacetylase (PgdA/CDA1 family)
MSLSSSSRGIILMYHRVTGASQDHWRLNVSPVHFQDHVMIMKKYGIPVSLKELTAKEFKFGQKGIALTFDDGYADNFYNAKPVLERHGIPATFYIVSGTIGSQEEYWWDEIEKIVFEDDLHLPDYFRIENQEYMWPRATTSHPQLIQNMAHVLRPLSEESRKSFMRILRSYNGKLKPRHLPLTQDELIQMAACKLFEIGAHSVTHPTMADLSEIEQEEEISTSKKELEKILGRAVTSFAYPYGSYSDTSIEILKRLHFKTACTVTIDPVSQSFDSYQLPRFAVRDWPADEFEKNLRNWLKI